MSATAKQFAGKSSESRSGGRSNASAARRNKTMPEPRVIRRSVGRSQRGSAKSAAGKQPTDSNRQRRVYVFGGLVVVLTVTSALLLALQPAPLSPDSPRSLMSLTSPTDVDSLFDTQIPIRAGRWKYIYIHHGGAARPVAPVTTDDTTAAGFADHFVIGDGDTAGDGEVKIGRRWNCQQSAGRTEGLDRVDPDCISICVAGDLDRAVPTPRQTDRLTRLVSSLQSKFQIGRDRVWVIDATGRPAGCGKYFPREAFKGGLLP